MDTKKELDALCAWPVMINGNGRTDVITPHKLTVVFLVQEFVALKQQLPAAGPPVPPRYRRSFVMLLMRLIQMPDLSYRELYILLQQPAYRLHPVHQASFDRMIGLLDTHGIEVLFDLQKFIETLITESPQMNHNSVLGHFVRRIVLTLDKLSFPEMMELYAELKMYYKRGAPAVAKLKKQAELEAEQAEQQRQQQQQQQQREAELAGAEEPIMAASASTASNSSVGNISVDSSVISVAAARQAASAAVSVPHHRHRLHHQHHRTQTSPMAIDLDDMDFDAAVMEDDDIIIDRPPSSSNSSESVRSPRSVGFGGGRGFLGDPKLSTREINRLSSNYKCWSIKQADLFVAQQCYLLENDEPRALGPRQLQAKLEEITTDNPLYAQAHILAYMNALRVRDVLGAEAAFYRAFDRSAVRSDTPKGFQYSSLNLAILHALFGHRTEALVSLRECVMLAQECGDRVCLQLAQSWLCLLDRRHVQLSERTVSSQTELSLVHSVSLGVQFIVNVAAVAGFRPAKLFELLMKSEVINCQHSLMDLMANGLAQKAAVWTLYGKYEVASLCSQLLLHVVRSHNTRETGSMENGEGVCHALCCTAMRLSQRGDYTLAAIVLQHARERFPRDPLARTWMLCDAYITSVQAMHRMQWAEAANACSQLYTLDRTVSRLQRAALRLRRGDAWGAERLLRRLLQCDAALEPLQRVRAWMLLAQCGADDAAAVAVLMEASVYASRMYLAYEAAMIDVHLAWLLLALRQPKQALRTVRRCMDTVLTDGGVYDVARMEFVFVRALVAAEEAGGRVEQPPLQAGRLRVDERTAAAMALRLDECEEIVARVVEKFARVEATAKVKDVYVWLALANDACGRVVERNRWARKLRELERWSPTPPEYANVFF